MRGDEVGLNPNEYESICGIMGRSPNDLELGLFGALWSEHCSYKSSKGLLARFGHSGPHVVQGPGENAGVVRLDENLEVAFKVESHNHPSYVEPVQGAATGVGGILRDIIAMGARPIAVADMLRFGTDEKSHAIMRGVVKGVGLYGNAIGIPTVTGDLGVSETYDGNPLVNVLAVGVRRSDARVGAGGACPGQWLLLVGQRTGRDGIHGASLLASRDFSGGDEDLRPTVQVGDPFLGKILMEATLETVSRGLAAAVQDLGAAGLASALAELCHLSKIGAEIWLERVPLRQPGLSPYEIMMSETQERMLLAVSEENLAAALEIFSRYEVLATVIGQGSASQRLILYHNSRIEADVDPDWLTEGAPRQTVDPSYWDALANQRPAVHHPAPSLARDLLLDVLAHPDVRDRFPIYRQYDSMVQTGTVYGPDHDAAVLKVRGSTHGLVLAVAGTGRWAAIDPYAGGAGVVLRVLAALAAQGAVALGLTDGVNAGNPHVKSSYDLMAALFRGVSDAAFAANVPITGGNVSLHNETQGQSIWPTVMMGALGRHSNPLHPISEHLGREGDLIYVVNPAPPNWNGSVAAFLTTGLSSYPRCDLGNVEKLLQAMREWVLSGIPTSVRTIGMGGLAATLVRMMAVSDPSLGVELTLPDEGFAETERFYNEAPLQWVAIVRPDQAEAADEYWRTAGVKMTRIGIVSSQDGIHIANRHDWSRETLLRAWRSLDKEVGW